MMYIQIDNLRHVRDALLHFLPIFDGFTTEYWLENLSNQ